MTAKQLEGMKKHFSLAPNHELMAFARGTFAGEPRAICVAEMEKRGIAVPPERIPESFDAMMARLVARSR